MVQITNTHWAVEVPDDAKNFRFGKSERLKNKLFYNTTLDYFAGAQLIELPPGTWQIICTSKDATEDDCAVVAGLSFQDVVHGYSRTFFHDLLASKGCDVNKNYLILKKG